MSGAQNIGIVAYDIYFPRTYVNQTELEQFDKAPAGKYTVGLGQNNMAFASDREDINSICLTVVQNLFEKFHIDPATVGRLEVGTETVIDKSKSVKSTLMQLFADSGNFNVDGIDTLNACYGGTNALFNTVQWMESSFWDGRYGLVVAGDVAVYAAGNARPTGGCGVVAMLIGPNAPIVVERGLRGTHMEHVYDFYKPNLSSEYPTVDGPLSNDCYIRALDNCYSRYRERFQQRENRPCNLSAFDYVVFHAPYNKLVQKSMGRLVYNDMLADPNNEQWADVRKYASLPRESTYGNAELDKAFIAKSKPWYDRMLAPATMLQRDLGNLYCGSVYAGLVSLLADAGKAGADVVGKRVMVFSYGSGLAASMFSLRFVAPFNSMAATVDLHNRLASRLKLSPPEFVAALALREELHGKTAYKTKGSLDVLFPGTYYLEFIDDKWRRTYGRVQKASL